MKDLNPTAKRLACLIALFLISGNAMSQDTMGADQEALSTFSRLIGGRWQLGNSYQEFEWGVGQLSVNAKSYFVMEGNTKLVSEGYWIWHPGLKAIKGYFTAIEMPYTFFEYTTTFENTKMVHELTTYSPDGKAESYLETWAFEGENAFLWTLYSQVAGDRTKIMEGRYERK